MASTSFSVKYRPIRIGLLVRKGELSDLTKLAGINSLLCGGIHNFIIPIAPEGEDNTLAEDMVKIYMPDTFYEVAHTKEIKKFVERFPFLRDPGHYGESIFYQDWHTKKNNIAYMDIINFIDRIWDRDLKNKDKSYKSNCTLVNWEDTDPLATVFSLQFGYFPKEYNLRDNFEGAFLNGLRSKKSNIKNRENIPKELSGRLVPLRFTEIDLVGYGGGGRRELAGLFFGEENNFDDLVTFWNLRASGADLIFCPVNHIERYREFIKGFLAKLDNLPDSHPNIRNYINIYHKPDMQDVLKIINEFETKKQKAISIYADEFSGNFISRPTFFCYKWQSCSGIVEKEDERSRVSISLPEKRFLLNEHPTDRGQDQQYLAVTLEAYSEPSGFRQTLKLPNIFELNEFYSREVVFDPWKLRAGDYGFSLLIKISEGGENLYPIPHQKIIEKILELSGIGSKMSQPGLITSKIIENMRDFMPLEACRVFKIRGIRKLLKSIKAGQMFKWNWALNVIWDNEGFKEFQKLYIESRDAKNLNPRDAFNFLIKKKLIRPKLRFLEKILKRKKMYKCVSCGLNSQIDFVDFENDEWKCPCCFTTQDLRPLVIREFKDQPKIWNFQKYGLFSKDNNQEGALPVILTLLAFARIFDHGDLFYSTALDLKISGKKFETDLAIFQHSRRNIQEIAIGEIKDEFGEINAEDVKNLKLAKERLESIDLSCHLIFAKTADSFTESEIQLFKELKEEGHSFILLTNKELEPYYPYSEKDENKLPHRYAMTMGEMATNSEFIYLPK